jgi:hypothetical protein
MMSLFDFSEQCCKDLAHNYLILLIGTLLANNIDIIKMNKIYTLSNTTILYLY